MSELDGGQCVEGWVVDPIQSRVFAHAWIELEDCIVDPLYYASVLFYFPGMSFDGQAASSEEQRAAESMEAVGETSLLCYPSCDGAGEGKLGQSWRSARAFADELISRTQLLWRRGAA
jgi:hypothetical protein